MGHVKHIDRDTKCVTTSYETISYDRLVLAAGSTNNHFGMPNLPEETFGIKTVAEAMHTRDEILDRLERGALCSDKERRRQLLSFLVVGGGPSGVEIAVADIGRMSFGGFFAWLLWMSIHLISILGMRNKLSVLMNWFWNYMFYSTSLRLLLRPTMYPLRRHWAD